MADDAISPEVTRPPRLTEEAVQMGVDGAKGWLRQRAFYLRRPRDETPTVKIPHFQLKMAEVVYRDIFESQKVPLLDKDFDVVPVPDLVEDFASTIDEPTTRGIFTEILTYLGFKSSEQKAIEEFSPRDKRLILESGLILWALESEMSKGFAVQNISDEKIEAALEEKFQLTKVVLPRCETKFKQVKQRRLEVIRRAVLYVEDFRTQFQVDRVENGVGVVAPRDVFQSEERFKDYLEELRQNKNSSHLRDLAPIAIHELIGKEQHWPHGGLDPFDHTLNVASELEAARFGPELAEYLRVASFLHDIGKSVVPKDPNHPYYSDYLADPILEKMGYDAQEREVIRILIRNHDWIRSLEMGMSDEREMVFDLMPPLDSPYRLADFIEVVHELARADIASMPWALRGTGAKKGGLTKERALLNLERRRQSTRAVCAGLERECLEMDRQRLPPLETAEATFDTVVYQALRGIVGAGVELPRPNEDLSGFIVDVLAKEEPQLVLESTYANRLKNIASFLSNYAEGYSDRIHQFVATFSLEIADMLLALEQRELGNSPKAFLRKQEVFVARRLLRQDWGEVVEAYLHGSSTFSFEEFLKENGLLASAEIDEQMRLIGEFELGVLPGREVRTEGARPVRAYVYLSSNPAVARAYARLCTAGEGYNLHPLFRAERASEQVSEILARVQDIERKASGIGGDLPVEGLGRYRAIEAASRAIADLTEQANAIAAKVDPMEFILNQLKYVATHEASVQRRLLTASPLIYGFSRDLPIDVDYVPTTTAWLDEIRVWGKAESEYLPALYVDSRLVHGYERKLEEAGVKNVKVIPIQSLDIYASIRTGGKYDDKVEEVYSHLRWRPLAKLGQKVD